MKTGTYIAIIPIDKLIAHEIALKTAMHTMVNDADASIEVRLSPVAVMSIDNDSQVVYIQAVAWLIRPDGYTSAYARVESDVPPNHINDTLTDIWEQAFIANIFTVTNKILEALFGENEREYLFNPN